MTSAATEHEDDARSKKRFRVLKEHETMCSCLSGRQAALFLSLHASQAGWLQGKTVKDLDLSIVGGYLWDHAAHNVATTS